MKKLSIYLILIAFITVMSSCQEEEDTSSTTTSTTSEADIVASSTIDLPSSISSHTSSASVASTPGSFSAVRSTPPMFASSSQATGVTGIYEGVRENMSAMDDWGDTIQEMTAMLYTNLNLASNSSGSWTNDNPTVGEPSRVTWQPDPSGNYDTLVELFWTPASTELKGFQAYLTIDRSLKKAKGKYTWDMSAVPDEVTDLTSDTQFEVAFNGMTEPKSMSLRIAGMGNSGDQPTKAWISVTQDQDHLIKLWGNYYFPTMDFFEATADSALPKNYVFAVTGYDEVGVDGDILRKNKALMQLAIPDASDDSTGFWTSDSIGAIFINEIRNMWINQNIDESILSPMLTIWGDATTDDALIASSADEVIRILEAADAAGAVADSSTDIGDLIFITQLVNPAYFDSTGFIGTWDGTRGIWVSSTPDLTKYDILDTAMDSLESQVATPKAVRDMTVGF